MNARFIELKELGKEKWPWVLKRPIYVELKGQDEGLWAFPMMQTQTYLDFQFHPLIGQGHFKKKEYNKIWRMWTDHPTKRQTAEIAWK